MTVQYHPKIHQCVDANYQLKCYYAESYPGVIYCSRGEKDIREPAKLKWCNFFKEL